MNFSIRERYFPPSLFTFLTFLMNFLECKLLHLFNKCNFNEITLNQSNEISINKKIYSDCVMQLRDAMHVFTLQFTIAQIMS